MTAATKQKRFQGNKDDKIENFIHCLKVQMEYKNINFDADKVKQHEALREAINSLSLKISFLFLYKHVFLAERYLARDRFRFSSIILSAFTIPES